jgi:methylmalonyl-CoA mutase C-terminal domain/subunit
MGTTNTRPIRVLLAKVGLDGHDRGVKVLALGLLDAGMEVIYTGLYNTAADVVESAIQEDVDVLGISCLSGGHMAVFSDVLALLEEAGSDVLLVGGGTIPFDEAEELKLMGVSEVFRSGTRIDQVVDHIKTNMPKRNSHLFGTDSPNSEIAGSRRTSSGEGTGPI